MTWWIPASPCDAVAVRSSEVRDGVVVMGVGIWRRIARRNGMVTWQARALGHDGHLQGVAGIFSMSQLAELVLEGVRRSNPVYVTPYVLGGDSRTHALDGGRTAWQLSSAFAREAGLDVKYSPTGITSDRPR
jgi:hypothetical protein